MIDQLRSELRKLRTTRTLGVVLFAAVALSLFGVLIEGLSSTLEELAQEDRQRQLMLGGSVVVFFATIAGVLMVTGEFRYGTIRPTLLFEPRRRIVLGAKLVAAALVGTVMATLCLVLSFAATHSIVAIREAEVTLTPADTIALVFGTIVVSAIGGMLGVAIGALIRNQVGAIVALFAYAFLVDATLFAAAPSFGRYLPGKAGDALSGQLVDHLLEPAVAAPVLVAWTLVFVLAATLRMDRSDV